MQCEPILMLTPFHNSQRGNTLTTRRLQRGLKSKGLEIDLLSLEDEHWVSTIQQLLNEKSYRLLHGFHAGHFARVLQQIPDIKQLPLVLTTTGTDLNYDLPGAGRNEVITSFEAVQKIVVFNNSFKDILVNLIPGLDTKLFTIPQGIFLEKAKSLKPKDLGLSDQQVVFVLPSGLRPVKNLELAIEALEGVQKEFPCLCLLIIGPVIDRPYAEKIFTRIKGLSWVKYLGEIPHKQIRSIFELSHVAINTSSSEGQPQGVLEAMSLGKPGILSAVPGNLNLIQNGVEGFYIKNHDELAVAAMKLTQDQSLREQMGQSARNMVERNFSLEQELQAYVKLYQELLRD